MGREAEAAQEEPSGAGALRQLSSRKLLIPYAPDPVLTSSLAPCLKMVDNPVGGASGEADGGDTKQDLSQAKGGFTKSNRFGCTCCDHLIPNQ